MGRATGLLALTVLGLAACGVEFADERLNKELPSDYKNRIVFADSWAFRYDLSQLAGAVFHKRGDEMNLAGTILPAGFAPRESKIDEGEIYSSKVDSGASMEGNYLAFAAQLRGNQIAEVIIADVARADVPVPQIPWNALRGAAAQPKPEGVDARYWVQQALLSTITRSDFSEISADASGVVGSTVGAKGRVYNKEEGWARDYKLAVYLINIDDQAVLDSTADAASDMRPETLSDLLNGGLVVRDLDVRRLR